MAHETHPSLYQVAQNKRVSQYKPPNALDEPKHGAKPSMRALTEAEMVEKGIQYWEEEKDFDHPSVEWWQLKSAKDFETGMGQKMFRGGTLSRWTDSEVKALQNEMEKTLASVGKSAHVKVATAATAPVIRPGEVTSIPSDALPNDISQEDATAEDEQKAPVRLDSVVDLDVYIAKKAQAEAEEEVEAEKLKAQAQAQKQSQKEKDKNEKESFQQLIAEQKKQEKNKKVEETDENDEKEDVQSKRNKHQRTRTEALRIKLEDMSKKLEQVHNDLNEEKEETQRKSDELQMMETESARNRRRAANNDKLKQEMLQLQGALNSAQSELMAAELQLQEKDQEIMNLKRELQITKELNNTLSVTALSGTSLTPDDLMNQRIDDANRFALMVAAMQEQLEFERNQFVYRIHQLELLLEHKDVQVNTLYELYNQLVENAQPKKGWFQRIRESVTQSTS